MQQQGTKVCVLCLSTGNADGLGAARSQELLHACALLGIERRDVTIVDDPALQDGMDRDWSPAAVERHVAAAVERARPQTLLTFDRGGVSGHPNHRAAWAGVVLYQQLRAQLARQAQELGRRRQQAQARRPPEAPGPQHQEEQSLAEGPEVYLLESWSLPIKYCALLTLLLALAWATARPDVRLCFGWRPWRAWRALAAHGSQMAWYRKLWMFLSSYMYLNTLRRVAGPAALQQARGPAAAQPAAQPP
eukprot:scaffold1.g5752.t1